jgi:hypothetical protein
MRPTLEDGLRALREASEQAASIRIDLDEEYLRAIRLVEALPQNQSGADKTWVSRVLDLSTRYFALSVRVR